MAPRKAAPTKRAPAKKPTKAVNRAPARRRVVTTKDPAVAYAEQLWTRAHDDLFNFQKTIVEIIKARAWEPLGYESFSKAWIDRLSDITIAVEIVPHVVYQMLDEGQSHDDITDAIKGAGRGQVENLARQKDNGVPVDQAVNRRPSKPKALHATIFIPVTWEVHAEYKRLAAQNGVTIAQVAGPAVSAAFAALKTMTDVDR